MTPIVPTPDQLNSRLAELEFRVTYLQQRVEAMEKKLEMLACSPLLQNTQRFDVPHVIGKDNMGIV